MEKLTKKDTNLLIIAFLSVSALMFGELLEQIVFVPNWLIGDIDVNMEHFRKFKHTTDPGMFYFPLSLIAIISHVLLLRKNATLDYIQRKNVAISLTLFISVLLITIYVIIFINVPVIDKGNFTGEAQRAKLELWAVLNMFRIILPAYGLFRLSQLISIKTH